MKQLKTVLILALVSMALLACGSGGGDTPGNGGNKEPKVSITGNIYNPVVIAALDADIKIAAANTPYSILNSGCSGLRSIPRAPVSQGESITVEWTIENQTDGPLVDVQYNVEFENAEAMHRETWTCMKWYDRLDGLGSGGVSIWEQSGGYFYNSVASPRLPACESPMAPVPDICDPATHDCAAPWWSIEHDKASGGCTQASGSVSLRAGQIITGSNSYSNSKIDIRQGHLARFQTIYNGRIMDEKCYVFEVMP